MPDPGKFKNKQKFISECIRVNINEGKEEDQAAAICYSMWRHRKKKKKDAAEYIREVARDLNDKDTN